MGHDSETNEAKSRHTGHARLVVFTSDAVTTFSIDRDGAFTIGRAEDADIRVDEPGISRKHAVITVSGQTLSVRDLHSKNGVTLDGRAIATDREQLFEPGQFLQLGDVSIVVQASAPDQPPARADLLRAPPGRFAFLVLRISGAIDARAVQLALSAFVQKHDELGARSPAEWELILTDTDAEQAELAAAGIKFALRRQSTSVQIGIAESPAEGRDLAALRAAAIARCAFSPRVDDAASGVITAGGDMRKLYRTLERIAASELSVVILGETGVGKEVVARMLHACSKRAERRFVALNCASFAEPLLESELFGHEKGAFTGALSAKPGLFERADGGTVFFDELGEMPRETQTKLLRVIEERTIRRLGSVEERRIDVRFLSATNRELEREVAEGRFRQDLYYRLNSFSVVVPPLRERREEIDALARSFAAKAWERDGGSGEPKLSDAVMQVLRAHRWPGNVRELKNVIERAVVLAGGEEITPAHLPVGMNAGGAAVSGLLSTEMEKFEREQIIRALEENNGNQTKAAAKLGLSRKVLMSRLDRYGIQRPRKG